MTISKYNSEGYLDLTAHDALTAIEQEQRSLRAFRPIVYICSPYAGDISANTEAARRYSRFAVEAGYIPIAPHLLFPQFLNDADPNERELGLFFGNALMSKCSEIWVFGSRISAGMQTEINRAKWKNYRLRYFTYAAGRHRDHDLYPRCGQRQHPRSRGWDHRFHGRRHRSRRTHLFPHSG